MKARFKFRAWDGKNLHNDLTVDGDGTAHIASKRGFHSFKTILMQCTGLKDKNDKLIFEGDILDFFGDKYKIEWSQEHARFFGFGEADDFIAPEGQMVESEIIGNIYENPELMEAESE